MHSSRNDLSCDTNINPFFFFKYLDTIFRAFMSKWFVGSSIKRKLFSLINNIANNIFVCSPLLNVLNGFSNITLLTPNSDVYFSNFHCS